MRVYKYKDINGTKRRRLFILQQLSQGESVKKIAADLHLSPRTVEGHIQAMRDMNQIRCTTHLVVQALRDKLIN